MPGFHAFKKLKEKSKEERIMTREESDALVQRLTDFGFIPSDSKKEAKQTKVVPAPKRPR